MSIGGSFMKRIPAAMIVALTALFIALSGVAVAGTTALISGSQIKDQSIPFKKLTPSAAAQLRGQRGPQGPRGAQGSAGAAGVQGPPGGFDPSKVSYVQGPQTTVVPFSQSGTAVSLTATCPAGTKAIAGGGFTSIALLGGSLVFASGWTLIVINDSSITLTGLYAFAVCASP
jgi:hypothetical protein